MSLSDRLYRAAVRAAVPAVTLAAPLSGKLQLGVSGRRESLLSMQQWAAAARDPARPLVWLHAPSVGEALMAQAILAAVRERVPHVQSAFTYFSPSAARVATRVGADWQGYLPWDTTANMRAALDLLRPQVIAFVRTEIWPVLVHEARARGAGVLLVNAALGEGSSRTRGVARRLLRSAYAQLDGVAAVHADDAARFRLLSVPRDRLSVTGDARFDQVWQKVHASSRDTPLLHSLRQPDAPLLVAGSTWPADEEQVVSAVAQAKSDGSRWRVVLAPHEPSAAHVAALESMLTTAALTHSRLPAMDSIADAGVDAWVVDRVGVLADLYGAADAAYVGGGFGSAGLHSVVEPAAFGVPVLCGPRHGNAQEAARLAAAGGATIVNDTLQLTGMLRQWQADAARRTAAGAAARTFVQRNLGGAEGAATLIEPWLAP